MSEEAARKKMAHVIAIGIKPEKDEEGDKSEEKEPDTGKLAAMEELMAALKKDDASAALEAWENLYTLCT